MNYLVSSTALILFALLYELSGAEDFAATSDQEGASKPNEARPTDPVFASNYVPFDQPIITPASRLETVTPVTNSLPAGFEVLQTSVVEEVTVRDDPKPRRDIRIVAGDWVNMRTGPATSFDVLNTLPRGVEAEILQVNDANWAEIRLLDTQQEGWMAAWLLSD